MTVDREMDLNEFIGQLPSCHYAHKEYRKLLAENKRLRELCDEMAEAHKQAKRVLLLEKAYRYQRAAAKLFECGHYDLCIHREKVYECGLKADDYMHKAAELYKQAEEI
jgi:uncharacterized protein YeeX (DUF496 family)